jgi:glycosyltransferase involved in cell wall biosynthesis
MRPRSRRPRCKAEADLRLLVFSPYFPPHRGGLEGYVSDLDAALLDFGDVESITVFTPRLPADAPPIEGRGGRHVVVRYPAFELIPNFPVPKVWSRGFRRARRSVSASKHDVYVSHTRFFLTSALALLCARLRGKPLLHVEHGSDYVQLNSLVLRRLAWAYDRLIGRPLLRRAGAVVAISAAAAEFVRELADRDAEVVHRGMWAERLDAVGVDETILARAGGHQVVTFAGRLIDGKGVADLLRAFARAEAGTAVVCIVGDGPRRSDLEALARQLGIADRALFLGAVPEEQAWAVLRASDVVVNPSYTEGLPTSVLEGALLGRAVLATNVGGTPEIITAGVSGVLVPPRDVEALRRGLDELLSDPQLRERLGIAARDEARRRFDWRLSARRISEVARSLA